MKTGRWGMVLGGLLALFLLGTGGNVMSKEGPGVRPGQEAGVGIREEEIVTVISKDAIPSIDRPQFVSAEEGDREIRPDEGVIGVALGKEANAYPIVILSAHEIVNDRVAGRPIAVTW